MLALRDLSKAFGGLRAVDGVTADFPAGRITGLVGPNGAGKTTIFNLITGVLQPTGGRVLLDGRDVTGTPPHRLARQGVGRTFQQTRIFQHLTVAENVLLARPEVTEGVLRGFLTGRAGLRRWRERTEEPLRFVGLADHADAYAGDLSYAEQKLVMLAALLAGGARVMLLDEPTAGLDPASSRAIIDVVRRLRRPDTTVILIEHNLDVVRGCCDEVVFLAEGRVVTTGTVEAVQADPHLAELYFGDTPVTHA